MTRWQVTFLGLILVVMVAPPVAAQTQDQAQARKHFVLAQAHEKNGDYADAAAAYLEAYKYFPSPEFFYNAGRAYELGGDAGRAVEHYERYISLEPGGRAAASAHAAIAKLKPQLGPTQPAPKEPEVVAVPSSEIPRPEPTDSSAEGPPKPEQDLVPVPLAAVATNATRPASGDDTVSVANPRPKEGSGTLQITGLSLAGGGLVATAVGVKFALDASSLSNQIELVDDRWTKEDFAKFDEGKRARIMSMTFTGMGVAAMIAGGSLYLWGRAASTTEKRRQTSMSPLIGQGSAGLVVIQYF